MSRLHTQARRSMLLIDSMNRDLQSHEEIGDWADVEIVAESMRCELERLMLCIRMADALEDARGD